MPVSSEGGSGGGILGGAEELMLGKLITPALGVTLLGVAGDLTAGGGGRLGGGALLTSGMPKPKTKIIKIQSDED